MRYRRETLYVLLAALAMSAALLTLALAEAAHAQPKGTCSLRQAQRQVCAAHRAYREARTVAAAGRQLQWMADAAQA